MKSMSFRYTKPDGDVSTRVFIPLVSPSANYFGIDISELSADEQLAMETQFKMIEDQKQAQLSELMQKFDIRHNFRSFSPERMQDVELFEVE